MGLSQSLRNVAGDEGRNPKGMNRGVTLGEERRALESRMRRNGAPRNAVLNPWRSQEGLGGTSLGHRVYLRAKAGGEKSMPEKRESPEGAYGAVPRGPRDKAKATPPEPQSPVVGLHTRCYSASIAALPGAGRSSFAVRHLRLARR